MKYFTKFLCLFLGAAMMLTMAACGSKSGTDANAGADGEKKQLVVATSPDFPPFEFLDGSQIVGIEPALMQAIADKLGLELQIDDMDFDAALLSVQQGKADIVMAGGRWCRAGCRSSCLPDHPGKQCRSPRER